MMKRVHKKDFPAFGKLPYRFDLEKLSRSYQTLQNCQPTDQLSLVLNARQDIAKHFPIEKGAYEYLPLNQPPEGSREFDSDFHQKTTLQRSRLLLKDGVQTAIFDERAYTEFLPSVPLELKEQLMIFEGCLARARFVTLKSKASISPHIDHPLHISIRVHIPIRTNEGVVFSVRESEAWTEFHLPADGSAYFVNTAQEHQVVNLGSTDRLHLVLNLTSLEPIEFLRRPISRPSQNEAKY